MSTVDGLIIVRDKYDELSLTHDNLVSYQLFRQRLVRLVEREIKISQETILLAIQSTEAEWRLHFGRSGKFIYDGKRFYTIISLLDYLGRPDDYSMVRSRMSKGGLLKMHSHRNGNKVVAISIKSLRYQPVEYILASQPPRFLKDGKHI